MAPVRARTRNRRKRDPNAQDLRELALFLDQGPVFRLGLATYDVPQTREDALERLAIELADRTIHLLRLDLSREPEETSLLRRLEDLLRAGLVPAGKHPAVMVVGLEATIDFRPVPSSLFVRGGELLRNANFQRDGFPERCPVPVVIWLNSAATTAFAQTAPDLGQWCTGLFHFVGLHTARPQLEEELISSGLNEKERMPREEKRERIGILRSLLLDVEKAADRDAPANISRRAALHYELGWVYFVLSDAKVAIEQFERSLELSRSIGNRLVEENSLGSLGNAYLVLGELDKAIAYYERTLEIAQQIEDSAGLRHALNNLGIAYSRLGNLERALDFFSRDLELGHRGRDRRGLGRTLNNVGIVCQNLGRLDQALGFFVQALEIATEINDPLGMGNSLNNLGNAYHARGEVGKAKEHYDLALESARKIGDRGTEGHALNNLGDLLARLGQMDKGIGLLEGAARIGREIQDSELVEKAERNLRRFRKDESTSMLGEEVV